MQPVKVLHVGMVYLYKDKPIYIYDGCYMGTYGISNFWYWRTIQKDGSLGKRDCGYNTGLFFDYPYDWNIRIHLKT